MVVIAPPKARSLLLSALLLLSACGGGGGGGASGGSTAAPAPVDPPVVDACDVEGQKAFVTEVTRDWYLWYDEMAAVSADDYATAGDYLSALTAPLATDSRDQGFSYLTTVTEDESRFTSGAYIGFGFRFDLIDGNRMFFADVFQGSPAGDAGFGRGNEVLAIDTGAGYESIAALAERGASTTELFGTSELGVERGFRVSDGETTREIIIAKRELDTPPLAVDPLLLERPGLSPVGYLNLRSFIRSATTPLNQAMATFREAGVTDLVIDLRYNGGGLLDVADQLLDLLGGLLADGDDSFRIAHNDKRAAEYDESFAFAPLGDSIEPLRIAFITTGGTASASELVINSLSPHVEVVLIGEDTLGKAVGQYAFDQTDCDTRLRLVAFELVNGEGLGGYYTGLADTGRFTLCPAADDVTRAFGDPAEASLATALGWLNAGVCGDATARSANLRVGTASGLRSLPASDWSVANQRDKPFGQSPWIQ